MDCSPAGMGLSRPGACSEPTSFFKADSIVRRGPALRGRCARAGEAAYFSARGR